MDKEKESSVSFNMSLATLARIDTILIDLNDSQTKPIFLIPRLEQLYKELYPFLNNAERKEGFEFLRKIDQSIVNIDTTRKKIQYKNTLFDVKDMFEYWLRDHLHKKGLLMAKSDDPATAITES